MVLVKGVEDIAELSEQLGENWKKLATELTELN